MVSLEAMRDSECRERIWLCLGSALVPAAKVLLEVEGPFRAQDEAVWRAALHQAGARLGLRAGDRVSVSVSDPALHPVPWEWLAGPAWGAEVVRALTAPAGAGSAQPPRPLRVLLALPEQAAAPLRAALAGLERAGVLSLTMAEPSQLAAYLYRRGYYHAVHVPGDAPHVTSAATVRRQFGDERVPLLVVHAAACRPPFESLVEGELTAVLLIGAALPTGRAAGFLGAWYASVTAGASAGRALATARQGLEDAERHGAVWLTSRLEGDVWPLYQPAARPGPSAAAGERGSSPMGGGAPAPWLVVQGSMTVAGDVIVGDVHKTVHRAGGDIVHLQRSTGEVANASVHQAEGDLVHLERRAAGTPAGGLHRSPGDALSPERVPQEPRPNAGAGGACPACGAATRDTDRYCGKCGHALAGS